MVMQEPIIFNYSILENVLYGKTDATNDEVLEACEKSNCMEFIENKDMIAFDDSAQALINEMKQNEEKIKKLIGEKAYEEEMRVLNLIEEDEKKKGAF